MKAVESEGSGLESWLYHLTCWMNLEKQLDLFKFVSSSVKYTVRLECETVVMLVNDFA